MSAAYRAQGVLDDAALALLANELWTVLDLAGSLVSEAGLLAALPCTPAVLTLDVTGCAPPPHVILLC